MRTLLRYARRVKLLRQVTALWLLLRDARTPRVAKLVGGLVLAYALSPIDLIPDFIPVLGALDDLIIIPAGIALVVRLVPRELWSEALHRAETEQQTLPRVLWGVLIVLLVWLSMMLAFAVWLFSQRPLV
jgi:uncharacterized membrane protein YkvA (DUF1232 family)